MPQIDLRSDTVTRPTPAMRQAMANAEVGDDVLGDDPTVRALEERAADLLGKEAGLYVASGTMGNLVAQMAHLARGQETITGAEQHMTIDEAAGHAVVVGASILALRDGPDGTLDPSAVIDAFKDPRDPHQAITGMIALENTHLHSMGQPLPPAYLRQISAIAHERGVPLHIDGARFWNAVVAQRPDGVTARDLADPADSLTFCLSKGLGCPVGSVLVGSRDFIWRARRARKLLGGGMRQVGILAAAGLVALQDGSDGMIDRLADDHANARRLADALADMPGIISAGGDRPARRRSSRPAARPDEHHPVQGRSRPCRVHRGSADTGRHDGGVLPRAGPCRDPSRCDRRRYRHDHPCDSRGARRDAKLGGSAGLNRRPPPPSTTRRTPSP